MARNGWLTLVAAIVAALAITLGARADDPPPGVDTLALRQQGLELMQKGDLAGAEKIWNRLITLDPDEPVHRYNLACTLAREGKADAAMGALTEAVDAGFANSTLLATDTDLDSLHDRAGFSALVERVKGVDPLHLLDFWVGAWDVFDAKGQRVGENIIESRNKGRMIFEQWKDLNDWVGCSQNFYDPTIKAWRQIWTDEAGGIVEYTGHKAGNEMKFTGTALARVGGLRIGSRMTLTLNDDGSVRQLIERQQQDGSWAVAVDFKYVKRSG